MSVPDIVSLVAWSGLAVCLLWTFLISVIALGELTQLGGDAEEMEREAHNLAIERNQLRRDVDLLEAEDRRFNAILLTEDEAVRAVSAQSAEIPVLWAELRRKESELDAALQETSRRPGSNIRERPDWRDQP